MFFAKWDQGGPWNYDGIKGPQRLLHDVWDIGHARLRTRAAVDEQADRALQRKTHQVIRKVTEDLESFLLQHGRGRNYGAAQRAARGAPRAQCAAQDVWHEAVDKLLLLLAPIAPHITEELWAQTWATPTAFTSSPGRPGTRKSPKKTGHRCGAGQRQSARPHRGPRGARPMRRSRRWRWHPTMCSACWTASEPRKVIVVKGKLVNIVI